MIYTFVHLKLAMTKEAIHLCTVQENDPNLTGKKRYFDSAMYLGKVPCLEFFHLKEFLVGFFAF